MSSYESRTYLDFHGFVDWHGLFPGQLIMWTVVGTVFLGVTLISYLPQTIQIIKDRSSYGLSGSAVLSQALGLWFLAYNVICLKPIDFVGMFQYRTLKTYARLLTFANLFLQWLFYLPVPLLTFIFHDRNKRESRGEEAINKDWNLSRRFAILALCIFSSLFTLFVVSGLFNGFESKLVKLYGELTGVVAFMMELVQFIPQLITTIKLRDNGSLSMLMLEIQAPTNLANGLFMWLGQGDSVTTFASALLDALQEFTLLGLCIYFKWEKKNRKGDKTDFSAVSMSLLERIEPAPINAFDFHADDI